MTDEGIRGEPMDAIEMAHALTSAASSFRALFVALTTEGFSESQALKIVCAQVHGLSGGKLESS